MFVEYLNERQQAALLHYAHEVMVADGIVETEERVHMEVLRSQMRAGVTAEPVPVNGLAKLFDRRLSRIAMFLELTGMGYANETFDPHQSDMLKQVAYALSLSDGDVDAVNSWVKRQLLLVKEAQALMASG